MDDARDSLDIKASTLSHLAQFHEILGITDNAIMLNKKGLKLRLEEKPLKTALTTCVQNNLGVAFNTANDLDNAYLWLERARLSWNEANRQQGKPHYEDPINMANMGRCLLYLKLPSAARRHVGKAIQKMRQFEPRNWGALA